MTDEKKLHYRGDRTNYDPDQVMGPDMFGGLWRPVRAEYDPAADMTTMYFLPHYVAAS